MKRETILQIVCAVLAIALIILVVFGCRCTKEGFENGLKKNLTKSKPGMTAEHDDDDESSKAKVNKAPSKFTDLTAAQTDLFKKITQGGSISPEQFTKMIQEGFLTEDLVEKFINKIQNGEGFETKKVAEKNKLEAFETMKAGFATQKLHEGFEAKKAGFATQKDTMPIEGFASEKEYASI
jgi:hypothetical protein